MDTPSATVPMWKAHLISGYQAFRAGEYRERKDLYERLGQEGQTPKVMLIACCDSRCEPSDIFNAHPGEMFVARNVANIVPPQNMATDFDGLSAALEYAVLELKVEAIVVMGHESCGGVNASLEGVGENPDSYIGRWISILNSARDRVVARTAKEDQSRELEYEGVRESLGNLLSYPYVRERVKDGDIALVGAYFSIIRGVLMFADDKGQFHEIAPVAPTAPIAPTE